MGPVIDKILYQDHRDKVFNKKENFFFSAFTKVEVWEAGRTKSRQRNFDDAGFIRYLNGAERVLPAEEEPRFRAILIPDTLEDTDRLQLTQSAFARMLDAYGVSARLPGIMRLQMQPSRTVERDARTQRATAVQYLYSGIVRSLQSAASPNDPTKRVLDWRRLCIWTRRDMRSGAQTMIILRCPASAKSRLYAVLGDEGAGQRELLRQPMLVHAVFAEWLTLESTVFSMDWAAPLYPLELELGRTPADYTNRARRFMTMARQIGNLLIDYDIFLASLDLLQEMSEWIKQQGPPDDTSAEEWEAIHNDLDGRNFETVRAEFQLLQRYGQLYEERTKIGNSESTALVNQHDADMNKQMSAESTMIARSAHRDGQSLRIIQYLGLFFLPLSLCTSIFGMGFFSSSPSADGSSTVFSVADVWWWFLALAVPLTLVVLAITYVIAVLTTKRAEKRRASSIGDIEKMYSFGQEHKSKLKRIL